MTRRLHDFQTIHSEGGLLPSDLLRRVIDPRSKLVGTRPEDYGLPADERLNEFITQSWNRVRKHWGEFRAAVAHLPEGEAGTALTNDKWTLPLLRELGFGVLPTSPSPTLNGRTYAISRFLGPVPVHLIGCGLSLDRRAAGQRGAAINPHGLVQEFLNRSPDHLWAILSNGRRLRLLRDSQALSRQSYLEFDLEAMLNGEVYADFVLLWRLAHATRFTPRDSGRPDACWLEQWSRDAAEQGTRALGELRGGVERALQVLGEGFTSHPRNTTLRDALRTGGLSLVDFHGQLLRVVYRFIFLFVAEDRTLDGQSLLHPRDESAAAQCARERYAAYYSTARLRDLAGTIKGSRHGDLWRQFQLLVGALSGTEDGAAARAQLALPALGSWLWSPDSTPALNAAELTNHDLLETLRHLAYTRRGRVLRPVDYRNLGAEELGGVYESLLALTPQISADGARFSFAEFAGNQRKTSGSYYTPDALVQCLLDSALDPVVEAAIAGKVGAEAEQAILALKVCDPAVGSGHFLVGAAHRLARHLARVRALAEGDSEASPLLYQHALRDVIGRCLYGVDINPMAAELCRVSLWLEALEPGKPLSFLDHHIRVGNSLLGTTPELIAGGLPDEAFKPIEGDDSAFCRRYKQQNKRERQSRVADLFVADGAPWEHLGNLAAAMQALEAVDDSTVEGIAAKQARYEALTHGSGYLYGHLLADAWCAAFVWPKRETPDTPYPITTGMLRKIEENPFHCPSWMRDEIRRLAREYGFFHWHLEFPEVFGPRGEGGFDCVLGNPPWERVKIQEKEWFAERRPEIADAPNAAARKRLIEALKHDDSALHRAFLAELRRADGEIRLLRDSGHYPLCGRGDINVYAVFAELNRALLGSEGRAGFIVPSGIATDDTTKVYFSTLVETHALASLYHFENEDRIFPNVHHAFRFVLLTLDRSGRSDIADLLFFARREGDLSEPERHFSLTANDFTLLNPNTRTCPIFRSGTAAELTKAIHRRVPVLIREANSDHPEHNPWRLSFMAMFHMANDSHLFLDTDGSDRLPLYEAKMIHQFDHRFGSYEGQTVAGQNQGKLPELDAVAHADPWRATQPRYWVATTDVEARLQDRWPYRWLLGWRDITGTEKSRTVIAAVIPRVAVNDKFLLMMPSTDPASVAALCANLCSFTLDYAARQKVGGTSLKYFTMRQLPILAPTVYENQAPWQSASPLRDWLLPRVLELTYTAWDLEPFAQDCGWSGPTFRWDEDRRFLLRCELDAAFFHLYLPTDANGDWQPADNETPEDLARLKAAFPQPREAVAYILDTFPIVRRKDEERFDGDYRTKRVILEIYDAMQDAIRTGQPYQTRLDPPPADPSCTHPPRDAMAPGDPHAS